jgi:hypothetical protein
MLPGFAMGGGIPSSGWSAPVVIAVSGDTTAVVVQRETAVVRSIDLRPGSSADGDAWAVLLFGSAFFLVAAGFGVAWLRGRIRAAVAVALARVSDRPRRTPPASDGLDPYPV